MKTLIVYKSVHQLNTEKVARAMADAVGAELRTVDEASPALLEAYDLIGFGSGLFYGKHHQALLDFVSSLPQQDKAAFVFSTSGGTLKRIHRDLRDALVQKGFRIQGEFLCPGFEMFGVFKYFGGFRKGRPNSKDLEKARAFVRSLLQKA